MTENINVSVSEPIARKTGKEQFTEYDRELRFSLLDFWQWSGSDLANNALRGKLAEFIVAQALDEADGVRVEWDAYDLIYKGNSIEVKSAAYVQSWAQKKHSAIAFGVRPTRAWTDNDTLDEEIKRQADIYVFCLLAHKDRTTLNPLNLDQWEFYVVRTPTLNDAIGSQKTLTLSRLKELDPLPASFSSLKVTIDSICSK